jgi:hypothetical protein
MAAPEKSYQVQIVGSNGTRVLEDAYTPVGAHGSTSALESLVTLTAPAGARALVVQVFDQNVRYIADLSTNVASVDNTPTASFGLQRPADDGETVIPFGEGTTIRFIEEAAGASMQYQWLG